MVPWQRPPVQTFVKENFPKFFNLVQVKSYRVFHYTKFKFVPIYNHGSHLLFQKFGVFEAIKNLKEYTFFIPEVDTDKKIKMNIPVRSDVSK